MSSEGYVGDAEFYYQRFGAYSYEGGLCDYAILLATKQDPHAVALFLQSRISQTIASPRLAHQLAITTAQDPTFHKYVASSEFQSSCTKITEYIHTLTWLVKHQPLHQPLAECGIYDRVFNILSSTQYGAEALHIISNVLQSASTHKLITAQHLSTILSYYFEHAGEKGKEKHVIEIVQMLLPTTNSMIPEQLLKLLQTPVIHKNISNLLQKLPQLSPMLIELGAVDTLRNLPNPPLITLETLRCLNFNSWTPDHACHLVRHLIKGINYNYAEILDTLTGDEFKEAILQVLREQFSAPILTEEHVKYMQRVLKCNSTKQLMAQALLDTLASNLVTVTLLSDVPEFMDFLISKPNPPQVVHLLQHLISTNNLEQLAYVINDLKTRNLLDTALSNKVCMTAVKAGIPTEKLPRELQDAMLAYLQIPLISRDKQAPWYIDPELLPPVDGKRKYISLPGQSRDLELVTKLYQCSPVPGYDIKAVTIIHSEHLFNSFVARVESLQERSGKEVFVPHWTNDIRLSQEELAHRNKIMDLFRSLAVHKNSMAPDVSFMLNWHGTRQSALHSLFSTGFANLASTDAGFFGKGLYTTPNADYAYRVYSSGALLLNWVAVFSPFPVTAQDEPELSEKGNFRNYDAHFAPVHSPKHPKSSVYHACEFDQEIHYSELVVFESAQMLARYVVELQPNMPREISPVPEEEKIAAAVVMSPMKKGFAKWSVDDVCKWFLTLHLTQEYSSLLQKYAINGEVLMAMKQQEWKDLGITHFGDLRTVVIQVSRFEM